jgi:hypothetical protein
VALKTRRATSKGGFGGKKMETEKECDWLDELELDRLQQAAEHPELADPLLFFLPAGNTRGEEE